jgi:hypothetical protein
VKKVAKTFPSIEPEHVSFIAKQKMFFVATAGKEGHVNISPKGYDTFRIVSPNQVAYLDLTGSGNETSAHLLDSNRITFMFLSFDQQPKILRLYGNGRVALPGSKEWDEMIDRFPILPGARQMIISTIDLVQTSCGYSVPLYTYEGERDVLIKWAEKHGENGLEDYRKRKNSISMDGIVTPIGNRFNVQGENIKGDR